MLLLPFFKVTNKNVSHIKLIWQFFHVSKRREKKHIKFVLIRRKWRQIYLFFPHAWHSFSGGSLWLLSWYEPSVFLILVCHDFSKNMAASFIDSLANPPQMKRKPPMKNGSRVEIIYVWRYNDVIRKKIISSLPERTDLFSLSHHDFT